MRRIAAIKVMTLYVGNGETCCYGGCCHACALRWVLREGVIRPAGVVWHGLLVVSQSALAICTLRLRLGSLAGVGRSSYDGGSWPPTSLTFQCALSGEVFWWPAHGCKGVCDGLGAGGEVAAISRGVVAWVWWLMSRSTNMCYASCAFPCESQHLAATFAKLRLRCRRGAGQPPARRCAAPVGLGRWGQAPMMFDSIGGGWEGRGAVLLVGRIVARLCAPCQGTNLVAWL